MSKREPSSENQINVTCAIINDGSKVLITRRGPDQSHPGKWEFPGGKIEAGETAEDCLAREILEELGIKIRVDKLVCQYEYDYSRSDGKVHCFFAFNCQHLGGSPTLTVHDKLAWVEIENLPNFDFVEADKQLVAVLLKNQAQRPCSL